MDFGSRILCFESENALLSIFLQGSEELGETRHKIVIDESIHTITLSLVDSLKV